MNFVKHEGTKVQFPQLRGSLAGIRFPAFAENKIDGELNYILFNGKYSYTINKYGNTRRDFPVLSNITNTIRDRVTSAVMICELYWGKGKAGALYELLSHKKDDDVMLGIFDVLEIDGQSLKNEPLIDRREKMLSMGVGLWTVPCRVVTTKQDAEEMFALKTGQGWEGVVVKDLHSKYVNGPCSWVKLKAKDRSNYVVTGMDLTRERIEIGCDYANKPRVFVGVKAPNRYKQHISIGDTVTIEHQGILPSGSLRHPVLIKKKGW